MGMVRAFHQHLGQFDGPLLCVQYGHVNSIQPVRPVWPVRPVCNVRTDSGTEFGSNTILIDRIRIESAAGSNLILIVQICTALDRVVDFNEHVIAFITGKTCTPSSDIKGGKADIRLRCGPAHNQMHPL